MIELPFRHGRWRRWVWAVWILGAGLWLVLAEGGRWRHRHWPGDPVAWCGGAATWHRPLWPVKATPLDGATLLTLGGNEVFRVPPNAQFRLGRWPVETETLSWAFWTQLPPHPPDATGNSFAFARLDGPRFRLQLGVQDGMIVVQVVALDPHRDRAPGLVAFPVAKATEGHWLHVGIVRERCRLKVYLEGRLARDETHADLLPSPHLAEFQLLAATEPRRFPSQSTPSPADPALFDDVAVFDRMLSDAEMAALAGARPGELPGHMGVSVATTSGVPWAALSLAVLLAVSCLPKVTFAVQAARRTMLQPAYRPVWVILLVGAAGTAGAVLMLQRQADRSDRARFDQAADAFKEMVETHFERVADLVSRARDWVAAQPEPTPEAWETWCTANHLPYDFSGLVGLGYAEQMLPGTQAAREAVWSARHGFPFSIQPPPPEAERWRPQRLQGQPSLPVVLYGASLVDPSVWRTNGSILGRDLLAARRDDPRVHGEPVRVEETICDGSVNASDLEEIEPAGWYGRVVTGLRLYSAIVTHNTPGVHQQVPPSIWRGVVFASIDPRRWLGERMTRAPSQLGFRIYSADGDGQVIETVLDSGDLAPETAWRDSAQLTGNIVIPHYGRRLVVFLWTTPVFEADSPRRWPWFGAATGGGFTLLAAGMLFFQVRSRQRESEFASRLALAHHELSRLSRERDRLSRDLHDGTIQSLYGLGLHLQHARRHLGSAPEKAVQGLEDARQLVQDTIVELRQFLLSLQPGPSTTGQTFAQAVESLLQRLRRTTPVDFDLVVAPEAATLPTQVVVQLVNVVREGLSNALRHGQPGRVTVHLQRAGMDYVLTVADDGSGFHLPSVSNRGFGLRTLRERAVELGGTLTVESAPGRGTIVRLNLPAAGTEPPQTQPRE